MSAKSGWIRPKWRRRPVRCGGLRKLAAGRSASGAGGRLFHRGFTLVEIMIVVAIIGLLAAIAIPAFLRARTISQKSACVNNLRMIEYAKDQSAMDQGFTNGYAAWDGTAGYAETDDMPAFSNLIEGVRGYMRIYPLCPTSTTELNNAAQTSADYNINPMGSNTTCIPAGGTGVDAHSLGVN